MAIPYKKIIKDIMGPDAKENGFVLGKNGPAGLFKRTLASYEKIIDSTYEQGFDIEYDSGEDKLVLWSGTIREERSFEKDNEALFRKIIAEFAAIMKEKGYKAWKEAEKIPRFSMPEHGVVLKNYEEISAQFCLDNNIDNTMNLLDKLNLIVKKVDNLKDKEFDAIKGDLIKIASFYTASLLACDETRIKKYGDLDYYAIVCGRIGALNTLNVILNLWLESENELFVYNTCEAILSKEEFKALNLKLS